MAKRKNSGYAGLPDPMLTHQVMITNQLLQNLTSTRSRIINGEGMDRRRSIDDECGYRKTSELTPELFQDLYDREPVAARVVEIMPNECWSVSPEVYEDEDLEVETEFESAWKELPKSLSSKSWYGGEEGNPIWNLLRNADIKSGIGRYGVILLGIDDGLELKEPAKGVEEKESGGSGVYSLNAAKPGKSLRFARVFSETQATIARFETNKTSPRYGQPVAYNITILDSDDVTGIGVNSGTHEVHWTRVVHITDDTGNCDTFAAPRCRPVVNNLYNLQKLYGGSAEMYWQGAFPGMFLETHPQLGGDVDVDTSNLQDQMEKMYNGLQRWMSLQGMSAKTLAPVVSDPTAQINVQLEAICIKIAVPKRIFVGSERGELASSQDQGSWNDVIRGRHNNHCTPRVIVPFIDRLILLGVLPQPEKYLVVWPDLEALTEQEQASIALTRTEGITKFIQGGGEQMITPIAYLTRFQGLPDDEAKQILEDATQEYEEKMEEQEAKQSEQLKQQSKLSPPPIPNQPKIEEEEGGNVENVFCPTGKGGGINPHCGNFTSRSGEVLFPATRGEDKVWKMQDGKPAPDHIQSLGIPPAWKNVFVNPDPNGDMLVRGTDAKGRLQIKYSENHSMQSAAAKFGRINELRQKRSEIIKEVDNDAKSKSLTENAECLRVIMTTGIRPGSNKETFADKKAFGATTLEGRHVKVVDGQVRLNFVGKKGVDIDIPVTDKKTADILLQRAKLAGKNGKLFNTDADSLRNYSKSKDGGGFKTKDHRTALGTETAIAKIKSTPSPKNEKEYKQKIKEVATSVSAVLGNTPSIALKAYIDPNVFHSWRHQLAL